MNHQVNNKLQVSNTLYFKQWSNKSFAAFCSMGKVVHIGNLAISLTQWIGNIIEHIENMINVSMDREVDEAAEELLEQELLQAMPVSVNIQKECGRRVNSKIKYELPLIGELLRLTAFFCCYGK